MSNSIPGKKQYDRIKEILDNAFKRRDDMSDKPSDDDLHEIEKGKNNPPDDIVITCPECGGTGMIYKLLPKTGLTINITCGRCGGSGEIKAFY